MSHVVEQYLLHLISAGIWVGAGLGGYVFVFNRWLLRMRDSSLKIPVMESVAAFFFLAPAVLGWLTPASWLLIPCAAYLLLAVDQARLIVLRKQMSGERPNHVQALEPAATTRRSRLLTTTDLHLVRYQINLLAPELACDAALTVAHLSDFHVNDQLPMSYYTGVFEQALAEAPDLVLLTGDYLTYERHLPLLETALAPLKGHPHAYAILGNHDYWVGAGMIRPVLEKAGLQLLIGQKYGEYRIAEYPAWQASPGGTGSSEASSARRAPVVRLFGSEKPWGRGCKISYDPASVLDIILTHTPDNIYQFLDGDQGRRAVFCGHLHAGQVCLPGNPPLSIFLPSNYGRRFDRRQGFDGHFVVNRRRSRSLAPGQVASEGAPVHMFVSGGVGTGKPAIRVCCPPDFFLVRFNFVGARRPCDQSGLLDQRLLQVQPSIEVPS